MLIQVANFMLPALQIVYHLVSPDFNVTNLVATVDQTTPQPQPSPLPEGYVAHPDVGFAYKVYDDKATWLEARNRCLQAGARLALIDSAEKVEYVERQVDTNQIVHVGFISLDNDRIWVAFDTGLQLTSLPWRRHQPAAGHNCVGVAVRVRFWNAGLINDDCRIPRNYVCEIPILENDAVPAN